jgi:hypothetical protein
VGTQVVDAVAVLEEHIRTLAAHPVGRKTDGCQLGNHTVRLTVPGGQSSGVLLQALFVGVRRDLILVLALESAVGVARLVVP